AWTRRPRPDDRRAAPSAPLFSFGPAVGWPRLLLLAAVLAASAGAGAKEACPERPPCQGCGCKGGPGYRGPDGRGVGFKNLTKVCGDPPETRCVFENAPGTGANHDCALGITPPAGAGATKPEE
ncbi:hypothetical protein V5F40_18970, partial [Xanthobacter sp. DSM 14520]|uniref:hypothetical protein n=1 Tax=Xanthobacter autotrophicus (strain ATCC BAA-1158 / Py2) TaxID=78245 RepID=UPI0037267890